MKSSFDMPKYIKKFFVTDNESIYFVVDGDFKYKDVDHTFIRSEGDMNWKRADFGFTPDVSFEILGVRENLVYFRVGDNEASRKQGIVNKVFFTNDGVTKTFLPFDDIDLLRFGPDSTLFFTRKGSEEIFMGKSNNKTFKPLPKPENINIKQIPKLDF